MQSSHPSWNPLFWDADVLSNIPANSILAYNCVFLIFVPFCERAESHVRSAEKYCIAARVSNWIQEAFISNHFTIITLSNT